MFIPFFEESFSSSPFLYLRHVPRGVLELLKPQNFSTSVRRFNIFRYFVTDTNRGKWAELTSKKLNFKDWQIRENRVDIINKKDSELGYFSFNNMGYIIENCKSYADFSMKTSDFIDFIASDKLMGENLHINRIGIRTILCKEFNGSFENLRDKINDNLGGISIKARKELNADLKDIACVFDLSDKTGNMHIICGSMKEDQLKQHFTVI